MRNAPIKSDILSSVALFPNNGRWGYRGGLGSYASKGRAGKARLMRGPMRLSQTSCESRGYSWDLWASRKNSGPAESHGLERVVVMRSCWESPSVGATPRTREIKNFSVRTSAINAISASLSRALSRSQNGNSGTPDMIESEMIT